LVWIWQCSRSPLWRLYDAVMVVNGTPIHKDFLSPPEGESDLVTNRQVFRTRGVAIIHGSMIVTAAALPNPNQIPLMHDG